MNVNVSLIQRYLQNVLYFVYNNSYLFYKGWTFEFMISGLSLSESYFHKYPIPIFKSELGIQLSLVFSESYIFKLLWKINLRVLSHIGTFEDVIPDIGYSRRSKRQGQRNIPGSGGRRWYVLWRSLVPWAVHSTVLDWVQGSVPCR